ncbi:hypothetical protein L3Q82_001210 [Scortum barcoo]|uniref:Uncharacterized protein n=1 Tax=Scortum barcoo TaxID=214431 RepID=A0ACB8W6X3_9TELE|nr:hypothetical protein L3Q82_001210 [Scortum barcoo]
MQSLSVRFAATSITWSLAKPNMRIQNTIKLGLQPWKTEVHMTTVMVLAGKCSGVEYGGGAVKSEEVDLHPGFNFSEAVGQSVVDISSDGFSGDVQMAITGVAVEVKAMLTYDVSKGDNVDDEQERIKHQTLWDSLGQRSSEQVLIQSSKEGDDATCRILVMGPVVLNQSLWTAEGVSSLHLRPKQPAETGGLLEMNWHLDIV